VAEGETPEVYGGRGAYVWATAIPLKDSKGQVIGAIECVRDITDSKRAELALRESEERLRLALEGTSDGIWDWDFNTGRTYFSPRYYTMLGYAPDEFPATYENWRKLLHPDDLVVAETAIQDYLQGQTPAFSVEFRCRTKDGGWRWILGRGKVVERDASGAPVRLAGSHSDISARKRVEEALRLTQFTVDQASEAIFWFDTQGRFNYVNEEACRMLGYSHDELVGMSIPDVDITIPAAGLASVIDNLSQSGLLKLESVLRHKDGRLLNVAITGRYLHFAGQSRMVAHIRDITDQKRAEEALRLIRFGVERSADAVYLIDPNNRFLDVNEAACAVLGYSRDELLSMGIVDIDSGVSDEMATELFERLREKGRLRMETRHRRKEGTTFPVEIMANYVEFGGREYNFCFVRDLTERKAAEAALHLTRRAIDAAAMAFEWYDDSGRIVDVNQQTCVELGFSREEMLSKHLSDIDPNFPAERWPEVWSRIKEQGALSIDTLH
ncbi:MAG TPA: PAS domain S-box protein, partial [Myxococcota bacterium]|nr:PAS domain S-box protein [Myxococcota bacterium]